ncbi:MAG: DUF933 domain-containing protein [Planctomycetota bacterium]|nr:DUF933 domain-containing protein [Planctomycetota bacterium]
MPLSIGLVGKPGSGKTTVFDTLQAAPGGKSWASGPGGVRVRTVEVEDDRLARLVEVHRPKRHTAVSLRFVDFPGRGGIGPERLAAMREADCLLIVVGLFPVGDESPPPPESAIRSLRDEWILSDLEVVENRLKRLRRTIRVRPGGEEKKEMVLLEKLRGSLEGGGSVRDISLTDDETKMIRGFTFLSAKATRVVANIGDKDPLPELEAVTIRGQVEKEIAELPEEERGPFLEELGVQDPAWRKLPRECLRVLDVVTFYTVVGQEIRAWTLAQGGTALDAAGRIHADMARGFVRAEVLTFEDFVAAEGPPPEKRKGRLESRRYVVQDGDILTIRFAP